MDAIEKIHEFERFGSVLGLERMNIILEKLGNPQDELKVIHVAGTNGKGSVCKYIYEVLEAAGYRTGLYTSPFLEVFNERIELDGRYITDDELQSYTDRVLEKSREMVAEGHDSPTEFEVVTAIALLYFKEQNCDYVVLEVGLGGRGDSTNVVKAPLCSVIASISLDHTDRLGDTIAKIAFEKAGIIKEDCPVVISTDKKDARDVFVEKAKECHADIYDAMAVKAEISPRDPGRLRVQR
jgi:dihydrofolate synthase/folylpolyglutamate synthase